MEGSANLRSLRSCEQLRRPTSPSVAAQRPVAQSPHRVRSPRNLCCCEHNDGYEHRLNQHRKDDPRAQSVLRTRSCPFSEEIALMEYEVCCAQESYGWNWGSIGVGDGRLASGCCCAFPAWSGHTVPRCALFRRRVVSACANKLPTPTGVSAQFVSEHTQVDTTVDQHRFRSVFLHNFVIVSTPNSVLDEDTHSLR